MRLQLCVQLTATTALRNAKLWHHVQAAGRAVDPVIIPGKKVGEAKTEEVWEGGREAQRDQAEGAPGIADLCRGDDADEGYNGQVQHHEIAAPRRVQSAGKESWEAASTSSDLKRPPKA